MSQARTPPQSGIDAALRARLATLGRVEHVAAGEQVIERGAAESHLFLIEEGTVEVLDDSGRTLEALCAGDLVGEFAFIENTPRSRDVVMSRAGRLRRIGRNELLTALSSDPQELKDVLQALGELRDRRREDLAGDAQSFVAELARTSLQSRGVDHPYLHALAKHELPDLRFALSDFSTHYSGYSNHFPRYLSTVIGRIEDHDHRLALLDNLTEESGRYDEEDIARIESYGLDPGWIVGVPHPLLFKRFQLAVGGSERSPAEDADQVVCWREMFIGLLAHGTPAEAIGALGLGTESIVCEIYKPFVAAISKLGLPDRDTVFFPLHSLVDDHHQETLRQIAETFAATPQGRSGLRRGMLKALSLRSTFWDWLYARALNPGSAETVV